MLSAFFDIRTTSSSANGGDESHGALRQTFGKPRAPKGRCKPASAKKAPKAAASLPAGASVHAKFEPVADTAPRPADDMRNFAHWQGVDGSMVTPDDDMAEFRADWGDDASTEWGARDSDSEPDFEAESLDTLADPSIEPSLGTSLEAASPRAARNQEAAMRDALAMRRSRCKGASTRAVPVYSGPELCIEDEDFEY